MNLWMLPNPLCSCRDWLRQDLNWNGAHATSRSPVQLPRLISFGNQLKLKRDSNGTELKHFLNGTEFWMLPDLLYSCAGRFPPEIGSIAFQLNMNESKLRTSRSPLQLLKLISFRHNFHLKRI